MIYKTFHGWELSHLGMGAMRLPTNGGGWRDPIDEPKARALIEYLYEQGVNYFDAAYRYHNGESEVFVGKVLSQYPRETWHLATKMPGHMMEVKDGRLGFIGYLTGFQADSPADIFEDQLARCGVEYFDVYMLHNVCDASLAVYMDEQVGMVSYLQEQKAAGRIRHLGFSTHGRADTIERFLEWRDCWDLVQMQLNYLDWTVQNAKRTYEMLVRRGIPVVAMEPCRGGKLATLGDELVAPLRQARPEDSVASWAFRFCKSLPNVQVVLSGMSTMEQAIENVQTLSDPAPLAEQELALLEGVVDSMVDLVPCTACGYCLEACPKDLGIPSLIALYNELSFEPSGGVHYAIRALSEAALPSNCIACGECARLCPQGIEIPEVMAKLTQAIANLSNRRPWTPPATTTSG